MRIFHISLITAICLFSSALFAEEKISYKSTELGTSIKKFLSKNKAFSCPPSKEQLVRCMSTKETYAGFNVRKATATFINDELSLVELPISEGTDKTIATFQFMTIEDSLSRRFGTPRKETDNLGGLERNIRVWTTNGERIQLDHAQAKETHLVGVMLFRDNHWENAVKAHRTKSGADI